jgi:hypothetical protein
MGRELITDDLNAENMDDAVFQEQIDPVDTLRRIAKEWFTTRQKCKCGTNAACSICEIDYLLDEAFHIPEKE